MNKQTPADPFEDEDKAESIRRFREVSKRLDMMPKEQKVALIEQAMERGELPVRAALITPAAHSDQPSPVTHHNVSPPADEQDNRHNPEGYAALRREIMAETLDTGGTDPDRWTRSAHWSELDHLALTRAAIWVAHADGYGLGITKAEATALTSRDPEAVRGTARRIVRRLSEIVAPPEADGQAVSGSEALSGIMPKAE